MRNVHPVAAAGFGAAADVYERARPSYPDEAVAWIVQRAGLGAGPHGGRRRRGHWQADAAARADRRASDRGRADRRDAREADRARSGCEVVSGTAEELPLAEASADAITVAQAFHWFDHERALPEFHRVLKPGGSLVLIWNSRDLDDPLQRGVEQLIKPLRKE